VKEVIHSSTKQSNKTAYVDSNNAFTTWLLLHYTKLAITQLRDIEIAKFRITMEQSAVLTILTNRGGKATITDIAQVLMRRRHSVSTLLERMQKRGLVKKIKYPKQKELEIEITKKGKDLQESITTDTIEQVFSSLSADEIQKLTDCLKTLYLKSLDLLDIKTNVPMQLYLSKI
jgi:DNA-binding MarR family transcriptional regulator